MERNILMTIEYDGTCFSGWQRQPGTRTVQGELESVLSQICKTDIKLNGTSRTDAGVHALGQRASFIGDYGIPTNKIKQAVNDLLAGRSGIRQGMGDIRLVDVEEVPMEFHARFNAKGKKYKYVIHNTEEESVFTRNYCYQVKKPLNVEDMRAGGNCIVGTHDFACFQAAGGNPRETTVRTVKFLEIDQSQDGTIIINIAGDGFLYNMVRIIAGTLVDVGLGKIKPYDIKEIIESKNRAESGHTAPPQGLYLVEVYY